MNTADGDLLGPIGQISIRVHDVDRAVAFYRDTLGLREFFRAPGMAFLECGGVRLMLSLPERDELDHPSSILYFRVRGIEGSHRDLTARGVAFEEGPHRVAELDSGELWMAFFRDPDRNLMALMEERSAGA